jgi:hypothetical protein
MSMMGKAGKAALAVLGAMLSAGPSLDHTQGQRARRARAVGIGAPSMIIGSEGSRKFTAGTKGHRLVNYRRAKKARRAGWAHS